MPAAPTAGSKRGRRGLRRLLRWVAWSAVASAGLLVAAWFFREPLFGARLRALLADQARTHAGLDLTVGGLEGDWLTSVELGDLRWTRVDEDALVGDGRAARVAVHVDPWRLARGDLGGLLEVALEGVVLDLDLTRPGVGSSDPRPEPTGGGFELPERLPRLALRDCEVALTLPDGTRLGAQGLELAFDGAEGTLSATRGLLASAALGEHAGPLRSRVAWRERTVTLAEVAFDGARLAHELSAGLGALAERRVPFAARLPLAAAGAPDAVAPTTGLELSGAWAGDALELAFTLATLDLARAHALTARFLPWPVLEGAVAGRGSARVPLADPLALTGEFELSAELLDGRVDASGAASGRALDVTFEASDLDPRQGLAAARVELPVDLGVAPRLSLVGTGRLPLERARSFDLDATLHGRLFGGVLTGTVGATSGSVEARVGLAQLEPDALRRLGLSGADPSLVVVEGLVVDATAAIDLAASGAPLPWSADVAARSGPLQLGERRFDAARAAARLDAQGLSAGSARVELGTDFVEVSDLNAPWPAAGADALALLRGARAAVRVRAQDLPAWLGESLTSPLPEAREGELQLDARLGGGVLVLQRAALVTAGGRLDVRRGQLALGRSPGFEDAQLALDAALDFADLGPLGELFGRAQWSGGLRGELSVSGALARPQGSFELRGENVVVEGVDVGTVQADAEADRQRLAVHRLVTAGALGRLRASGELDFAERALTGVTFDVESAALARLSGGRASAARVAVEGRAEGTLDAPRVTFSAGADGLEVAGRTIEELAASGSIEPLAPEPSLALDALTARVGGLDVEASAVARRTASGGEDGLRVELARLLVRDGENELRLVRPVALDWVAGSATLRDLELGSGAGVLKADLERDPERTVLALEARAFDVGALLAPFLPPDTGFDAIDGQLRATIASTGYAVDAQLEVRGIRTGRDWPGGDLSARGALADGRLVLERLAFDGDADLRFELSGEAPLVLGNADGPLGPGPLALRLDANVPDATVVPWARFGVEPPSQGHLTVSAELSGSWSAPRGEARLDVGLDVPPRAAAWLGTENARVTADGRVVVGEELALDGVRVTTAGREFASVSGSLGLDTDVTAWLRGAARAPGGAAVDLRAVLAGEELAALAPFVPGVRRLSGKLGGEVQVGGTLDAPTVEGRFELSEAAARIEGLNAGLDNLNGAVALEGKTARIVSLTGEWGAGPFELSGSYDFAGEQPVIELRLDGKELLLARSAGLRVRADASLTVAGPLDAVRVAGTLALVDGRWSRDFDFLGSSASAPVPTDPRIALFRIESGPLANATFDIALTAREDFLIRTNVVKSELRPDLRLTGRGDEPLLVGRVDVTSARVQLPASTFVLDSGTITFDRFDPMIPRVQALARARVRGYEIDLRVAGPYHRIDPELSSRPPLSQEQIRLLALTGQSPESVVTRSGSEDAAGTLALWYGKDVVARWFGVGEGEDESILDRLEFETGRKVSQAGVETAEATFRISDDPDKRTRVLFLTAERDVYERINFGLRILFRHD